MTYDEFIAEVQRRGGFTDAAQACNATRATMEALGERLWAGDARAVAECLPRRLGNALRRSHCRGDCDDDIGQFYSGIAEKEGVDAALAATHARVVCRVLMESVDEGAQLHLRVHLPATYRDVLIHG